MRRQSPAAAAHAIRTPSRGAPETHAARQIRQLRAAWVAQHHPPPLAPNAARRKDKIAQGVPHKRTLAPGASREARIFARRRRCPSRHILSAATPSGAEHLAENAPRVKRAGGDHHARGTAVTDYRAVRCGRDCRRRSQGQAATHRSLAETRPVKRALAPVRRRSDRRSVLFGRCRRQVRRRFCRLRTAAQTATA